MSAKAKAERLLVRLHVMATACEMAWQDGSEGEAIEVLEAMRTSYLELSAATDQLREERNELIEGAMQ